MRFETVLIANRGEIACRIQRSARALGHRAVAVYNDADRDATHVAGADLSVHVESYLSSPALIEAARKSGADAVHPGYGFLSENADFAAACEAAGLVFIGPPVEAVRLMANKRLAKLRMAEADVPIVPGYSGEDQSEATLLREANRIGFPVMVKAAAGGGGRGMRLVDTAGALPEALQRARSEAEKAFGSGELILEKAILRPRHVEVQVFADAHGNVLHLGERDCSAQRRHQKVIEEAPSPAVDENLRRRMTEVAVRAAASIGYRGAGTIEFLLDESGAFYFLEMNTRIQVEHPVTEAITGIDLVEWQLRVAAGENLPLRQDELAFHGHAIEARLYAEDPSRGFLPQTGTVHRLRWPEGVRVDAGIVEGSIVRPEFDPMLAKIVARARDRETARRRLVRALEATSILGVVTNRSFLIEALRHPTFANGTTTTEFLAGIDAAASASPSDREWAIAAALAGHGGMPHRTGLAAHYTVRLACGDEERRIRVARPAPATYEAEADGATITLDLAIDADGARCTICGVSERMRFHRDGAQLFLDVRCRSFVFEDRTLAPPVSDEEVAEGTLVAPITGTVRSVAVTEGAIVRAGDTVLVIEAMKMEFAIVARIPGTVTLHARRGELVQVGRILAAVT
jgi:geranyl-CoA carboxylase alpha subunit